MSKVVELVEKDICPLIEGLGYEVVEVEYAKKVDGMNLCFYIDNPNGITIEDCEKVHKFIDEPLDKLNPTNDENYILSVSSCGLDRPIKTDKDFNRNLGKNVDVKLYAPIDKKKEFVGKLVCFDDKSITLDVCGENTVLPREKVANVVLHLDF